MTSLRIIRNIETARITLLRRVPVGEAPATPEVARRLRQVFDADLTPFTGSY
jgi:hypothetical protein